MCALIGRNKFWIISGQLYNFYDDSKQSLQKNNEAYSVNVKKRSKFQLIFTAKENSFRETNFRILKFSA